MSRQIPDQLIAIPIVPFFLGGCLSLLPDATPVQAQTPKGSFLLAERTVVNTLPPPPSFQTIPYNQPRLTTQPTLWNNSYNQNFPPSPRVRVNQYNQNSRPYQTVQANSYSWSAERYIVYVDGNDSQQLQRIRQLERSAYIRHYNGRAVIQSGAFTKQANAQQRVRELELSGINGARIVKSNGQEIASYDSNSGNNSGNNRQGKSRYYYVTIPARAQDLSFIASRIRENSGRYDIVVERQQPLGPHVAVGPFAKRSEAEQWNDYLQKLGFGNARVYYGK